MSACLETLAQRTAQFRWPHSQLREYWKCNFPLSHPVRPLRWSIGWSVCPKRAGSYTSILLLETLFWLAVFLYVCIYLFFLIDHSPSNVLIFFSTIPSKITETVARMRKDLFSLKLWLYLHWVSPSTFVVNLTAIPNSAESLQESAQRPYLEHTTSCSER